MCLGGMAVMAAMIILKHMFRVNADTIKWAGQRY